MLAALSTSCVLQRDAESYCFTRCSSTGLLFFNQDGIYFIPTDSCCALTTNDSNIDGLILLDRIRTVGGFRKYNRDDLKRVGAKRYRLVYTPGVARRCIHGVNDDTYFIKEDSCYLAYVQVSLCSYSQFDRRIESIYNLNVAIAGQAIDFNIIDGQMVYFKINQSMPMDSIQLADILTTKKMLPSLTR